MLQILLEILGEIGITLGEIGKWKKIYLAGFIAFVVATALYLA